MFKIKEWKWLKKTAEHLFMRRNTKKKKKKKKKRMYKKILDENSQLLEGAMNSFTSPILSIYCMTEPNN